MVKKHSEFFKCCREMILRGEKMMSRIAALAAKGGSPRRKHCLRGLYERIGCWTAGRATQGAKARRRVSKVDVDCDVCCCAGRLLQQSCHYQHLFWFGKGHCVLGTRRRTEPTRSSQASLCLHLSRNRKHGRSPRGSQTSRCFRSI